MQATDQAFFEAYKRLDRLCSDAFSCRNGVTAYIDEMNRCSPRGRRLVLGWEQDLSTLKALRHLRNRMAHELDTDGVCTEADAAEAGDFHARILSGNDPLARLNRMAAPERKPPIAGCRRTCPAIPGDGKNRSGTYGSALRSPPR